MNDYFDDHLDAGADPGLDDPVETLEEPEAGPLWDTDVSAGGYDGPSDVPDGSTPVDPSDGAYPNPDGTFGTPELTEVPDADPYSESSGILGDLFADRDGNGTPDLFEDQNDNWIPDLFEDPYGGDTPAEDGPMYPHDPGLDGPYTPIDPDDGGYPPFGDDNPYQDPYFDDQGNPIVDPADLPPAHPTDGPVYPPAYDAPVYDPSDDGPYAPVDAVPDPADWSPSDFDGIGEPVTDAALWHLQEGNASCAVVAQGMILEDILGVPFDEDALVNQAVDAGIFDPENGTYNRDIGKLLEMNGVDCDQVEGADIQTLIDALENGDRPIVSLDANEIWEPMVDPATGEPIEQDPPAGHAVWITGMDIETNPDGSQTVYVLMNDSGNPGGACQAVELDHFMNAWGDTNNFVTLAHPA